jgi:hypothetical protein
MAALLYSTLPGLTREKGAILSKIPELQEPLNVIFNENQYIPGIPKIRQIAYNRSA